MYRRDVCEWQALPDFHLQGPLLPYGHSPSRSKDRGILDILDKKLRLYNSNGFFISTVYCDNEFKKVYPNLRDNRDGVTMDFSTLRLMSLRPSGTIV